VLFEADGKVVASTRSESKIHPRDSPFGTRPPPGARWARRESGMGKCTGRDPRGRMESDSDGDEMRGGAPFPM
jgi:hypothetical protein